MASPSKRLRKHGSDASACDALPGSDLRVVGGTVDYRLRAQAWPSGPADAAAVLDWPSDIVSMLKESKNGGAMLDRLIALWHPGVVVHSDCSGRMTPEIALRMVGVALGTRLPQTWLASYRATDIDQLCQQIAMRSEPGPMHLWSNILDRVPSALRATIVSMRPAPEIADDEKAEAMKAMGEFIHRHKRIMFPKGGTARGCLKHPGAACRVSWQDPPDQAEGDKPLKLTVAGCPCLPWTSFGAGKGFAHPSLETWYLWSAEAAVAEHDLIFSENAPRFHGTGCFEQQFGQPTYEVLSIVMSPHQLGYPVRRSRTYQAAINREELVWIGPTSAEGMLAEYWATFGRRVDLEGDVYAGFDWAPIRPHARFTGWECRAHVMESIVLHWSGVRSAFPPWGPRLILSSLLLVGPAFPPSSPLCHSPDPTVQVAHPAYLLICPRAHTHVACPPPPPPQPALARHSVPISPSHSSGHCPPEASFWCVMQLPVWRARLGQCYCDPVVLEGPRAATRQVQRGGDGLLHR